MVASDDFPFSKPPHMICPSCGYPNLPGCDECARCKLNLSSIDYHLGDRIEVRLTTDTVGLLKPKKPVTVSDSATLSFALQLMIEEEIGALLVVGENDTLLGILTERDVLNKVVGLRQDYGHVLVRELMTTNPESVGVDDLLVFALQKMDVGGYRHLPVLCEGKPIGIISVRDMIRYVTRLCRD